MCCDAYKLIKSQKWWYKLKPGKKIKHLKWDFFKELIDIINKYFKWKT